MSFNRGGVQRAVWSVAVGAIAMAGGPALGQAQPPAPSKPPAPGDVAPIKPGETAPQTVRPRSTGRVPQAVLDDFMSGFQGDEAAFERAMAGADKAIQEDPANAEALAWKSAGMGMRAGKAFQSGDFREGIRQWQESMSGLNKSVEMEPGNVHIRFVRGKSMLESALHDPNPSSSGAAAQTAIDDLELALGSIDDLEKRLPKATREEFYSWLYQASEKVGDKERAAKYKKLAGERAKLAEQRLAEGAKPSAAEMLRATFAILDTPLAKDFKSPLTTGLTDVKKLDAVVATIDALLVEKPGDVPLTAWHGYARMLRGVPLFLSGKTDEAVKAWGEGEAELNKAVAADGTSSEALVLRGLTELERARHEFDDAERKAAAVKAAADLVRVQRQAADAAAAGGKALMSADQAAELSIAIARSHAIAGEGPMARAALEAAVKGEASEGVKKRAREVLEKIKQGG